MRAKDYEAQGDGHTKPPAEIEREIEDTRVRMNQTIRALREDLSPGQLIDRALHSTKSGQVASSVGRVVRDNPIPTAMVGIGLTWLVVSSGRGTREARTGIDRIERLEAAKEDIEETARAKEIVVKEKASALKERAQEMRHAASDTAHAVAERARETRERAGEAVYRAKEASSRTFESQPLLVGALAIGVGALIGALLPPTQTEDRLLGSKRDQLKRKAAEARDEVIGGVREGGEPRAIDEETRATPVIDESRIIP